MKKLSDMSSLQQRTISAVVLAPLVLAIIYVGGLIYQLFVATICAVMLWEWFRMTKTAPKIWNWRIGGLVYIIPPCIALLILEQTNNLSEIGITHHGVIFKLLAMIWAVDIFAYIFGKTIGGPKIAPKISPNKTWAGLAGGIVGAFIVCYLITHSLLSCFLVAPLFAIIAQIGDFFESWVKRKFNTKDSSNIIPGHGGLLDRLDGLLAVLWVSLLPPLISSLLRLMENL